MKKLILCFCFFKTIPMLHILFDLSEDTAKYVENLKIENNNTYKILFRRITALRNVLRDEYLLNYPVLNCVYFPSHTTDNVFYGLFNTYQLGGKNPSCNIVFVVNAKNQKINDEKIKQDDEDRIIAAVRNTHKEKINAFLLKARDWKPSIKNYKYDPLVIFLD